MRYGVLYSKWRALFLLAYICVSFPGYATPPRPFGPIPTAAQVEWQRMGLTMLIHFGVNTFSNREWGRGDEDPNDFDPTNLDCGQWARVAKDCGFKMAILTAKHHDGFCLWPSKYTNYSVASSSWRSGRGDVLREFTEAFDKAGLKHGFYLSPWDRHDPRYATPAYNDYYIGQLTELIRNYPTVFELWLDGAKGDNRAEDYAWQIIWNAGRQLQPNILMAVKGPQIRWVGNESGIAAEDESSVVNLEDDSVDNHAELLQYWGKSEIWYPVECDVSIRPGWFWHANEDKYVKSVDQLLHIYLDSVGRGGVMLLNVPANSSGRLADPDVKRLYEFKNALDRIFRTDFARQATITASNVRDKDRAFGSDNLLDDNPDTYWASDDDRKTAELDVDLKSVQTINLIRLEEPIAFGERIEAYHVDALIDDKWKRLFSGKVIGNKQLRRFPQITTQKIRIVIDQSRACPLLSGVGIYNNPYDTGGLNQSMQNGRATLDVPGPQMDQQENKTD